MRYSDSAVATRMTRLLAQTFAMRDFEGGERHDQQMLEGSMLAFANDRGARENDRQESHLIDDGDDARKPRRYAIWIEQSPNDQIDRRLRRGVRPPEKAGDAIVDDFSI